MKKRILSLLLVLVMLLGLLPTVALAAVIEKITDISAYKTDQTFDGLDIYYYTAPGDCNNAMISTTDKLTGVEEKPTDGKTYLVNNGLARPTENNALRQIPLHLYRRPYDRQSCFNDMQEKSCLGAEAFP